MEQLTRKIADLEKDLEAAREARSRPQAALQEAENTIERLRNDNEELRRLGARNEAKAAEDIARLRKELETAKRDLIDAQQEAATNAAEADQAQHDAVEAGQKAAAAAASLAAAEAKLAKLSSQLEEAQATAAASQEQVQELRKGLADAKAERKASMERLEKAEGEAAELRRALDKEKQELATEKQEHDVTRDKLAKALFQCNEARGRVAKAEADAKAAREAAESARKNEAGAVTAASTAADELRQERLDHNSTKEQLVAAVAAKEGAEAALGQAEQARDAAAKDAADAGRAARSAENRAKALLEAHAGLEEELRAATQSCDSLRRWNEKLKAECDAAKEEAKSARDDVMARTNEHLSAMKVLEDNLQRQGRADNEASEAQHALEHAIETEARLESDLERLEGDLETSQARVAELEKLLAAATAAAGKATLERDGEREGRAADKAAADEEIHALREQLAALSTHRRTAEEAHQAAVAQAARANKDHQSATGELERARGRVEELQKTLDDANAANAALTNKVPKQTKQTFCAQPRFAGILNVVHVLCLLSLLLQTKELEESLADAITKARDAGDALNDANDKVQALTSEVTCCNKAPLG